jgi:hypothetical protein
MTPERDVAHELEVLAEVIRGYVPGGYLDPRAQEYHLHSLRDALLQCSRELRAVSVAEIVAARRM